MLNLRKNSVARIWKNAARQKNLTNYFNQPAQTIQNEKPNTKNPLELGDYRYYILIDNLTESTAYIVGSFLVGWLGENLSGFVKFFELTQIHKSGVV